MMKNKFLILFGLFAGFYVGNVNANTINYEKYSSIKKEALNFEKTLEPVVLSALNLSNGPILKDIFETCVQLQLPTSFEVVARVNLEGVVEDAWSDTKTLFGQCAAKVFVGKFQLQIGNQYYYSILNFTLEKNNN